MANEIRWGYTTGSNLFAIVRNEEGEVWYPTGEAFETYATASRTAADYALSLIEYNGLYLADFPEDIEVGDYYILIFLRATGTPLNSDTCLGKQEIAWTGSTEEAVPVTEVGATQICNRGILMLGGAYEENRIDSYSTNSTRIGQACRDAWPMVRREMLERLGWLPALSYADLGAALAGSSLIAGSDWEYQFNLPDDCLWVVRMTDEDDHTVEYDYEVKQGQLLTNEYTNTDGDSAYIEYVKDEGNIGLFMASFHRACATAMAVELAPMIDPKAVDWLQKRLELIDIPRAIAANQQQVYVEDEKGSFSWLDARDV